MCDYADRLYPIKPKIMDTIETEGIPHTRLKSRHPQYMKLYNSADYWFQIVNFPRPSTAIFLLCLQLRYKSLGVPGLMLHIIIALTEIYFW